jgi:NADP-dependent 3-hydroxy acid dehydrogenase YdfG
MPRLRRRPGEVVVITGASAGVGRATARAFARRGAHGGLIARDAGALAAARDDVERLGGKATICVADVARAAEVESAAAMIEERLGPIDVWVNNAMVTVMGPVAELDPDEIRRVTEVTYLGTVNGTLAALARMRPRNRGTIVQVGSALAYRGIPLQTAYCGAKHAIQGFNEALRCELLHDKSIVRKTMLQLPAVNTPQFDWVLNKLRHHAQPVPPIYQPEVIADAILYAADHPKRREYWVGGTTAGTLLANAVAPGLLDRYLARTGFSSQQTSEPNPPNAPANLWEPADGFGGHDFGAHGSFDGRSTSRSLQVWLSQHHGLVLGGAAAAVAGVAAAFRR